MRPRHLFDPKHSPPQTGIFILKAELEETGMLCRGGARQGCLGVLQANAFVKLDTGEPGQAAGSHWGLAVTNVKVLPQSG